MRKGMVNIKSKKGLQLQSSNRRKVSWLHIVEETLISSWWLILYALAGGFVYDRALTRLKTEESRLQYRIDDLHQRILCEEVKYRNLTLHLECWDNPDVMEISLIRKLGLVPQGYTKVMVSPFESTFSR